MNLINYVCYSSSFSVHKCGYCPPVLTHVMIILFKYKTWDVVTLCLNGCLRLQERVGERGKGERMEGGEDGMREIGREIM